MFFALLTSFFLIVWFILCIVAYSYHYLLEEILELPTEGQPQVTAHVALKQIIQKILRDALHISSADEHQQLPNSSGENHKKSTYEDFLSTAILNKVVNTHSSSNNEPSSEELFTNGTHNNTISVSSLEEPWMPSSNACEESIWDGVDATVESKQEYSLKQNTEQDAVIVDDEDVEYFRKKYASSKEDPNWRLEKRRGRLHQRPTSPVSMLVPKPIGGNDATKVLIGDREVDDTSDLSDTALEYDEDDDEEQVEELADVKTLLVKARTLIGGKNAIDHMSDADESSTDSGVKTDRDEDISGTSASGAQETVKTISISDEHDGYSLVSINSNTEQDTEYTESYASLPGVIEKKLLSVDGNQNEENEEATHYINQNQFLGEYSKKDKEKWNNPVKLEYNPYSRECIEQRINEFGSTNLYETCTSMNSVQNHLNNREIEHLAEDNSDSLGNHHSKRSNSVAEEVITSDSDASCVIYYDVETAKIYQQQENEITSACISQDEDNNSHPEVSSFSNNKPVALKRSKYRELSMTNGNCMSSSSLVRKLCTNFAQNREQLETDENLEICELKEKKLVANRLGEYSKSMVNLSSSLDSAGQVSQNNSTIDIDEVAWSVKAMKKLFEDGIHVNEDNKDAEKMLHSLTARSLSKPMRDKLKVQNSTVRNSIVE